MGHLSGVPALTAQVCATRDSSGNREGSERQRGQGEGTEGRFSPLQMVPYNHVLQLHNVGVPKLQEQSDLPQAANGHSCKEQQLCCTTASSGGWGCFCPPQESPLLLRYHLSRCPSAPSSMPQSHLSGCPGPGLKEQHRACSQPHKTNSGFIVSQWDPCADEPPPSLSTPQPQPNMLLLPGCRQIGCRPSF